MEKLDLKELIKTSRNQDMKGTLALLRRNLAITMSWGMRNFINYENRVLRMTVSGHHHKGHVYIRVSGRDLYDVYYTSNQGNIKFETTDLYFDQLQEVMDEKIECIESYI